MKKIKKCLWLLSSICCYLLLIAMVSSDGPFIGYDYAFTIALIVFGVFFAIQVIRREISISEALLKLVLEVHQKEWAILTGEEALKILATPNVFTCTAFYGIDRKNKVIFLCHFDWPCSSNSLPLMFKKLRELRKEYPDLSFETFLEGGLNWQPALKLIGLGNYHGTWSHQTRNAIKRHIDEERSRQDRLTLTLLEKPYSNERPLSEKLKYGWSISLKINVETSCVDHKYPKQGVKRKPSINLYTGAFSSAKEVPDKDIDKE